MYKKIKKHVYSIGNLKNIGKHSDFVRFGLYFNRVTMILHL